MTLGMHGMISADRSCWFVQLNRAVLGGTAELTNAYQAFVSSFPKSEIVQQKAEHGTDHDMISLKEKCWRRSTECAQEIHHCCLSSLITMAVMGCMLLLYFGFFGMNRP